MGHNITIVSFKKEKTEFAKGIELTHWNPERAYQQPARPKPLLLTSCWSEKNGQ